MKQVETGRVGSTDGRPDEFVWELGFLLEARASTGSGIDLRDRKTNNAIWDVRNNYERRTIARDTA